MRWGGAWAVVGALTACASPRAATRVDEPAAIATATQRPAPSIDARELYAVAEVAYADGAYPQAVALLRRALLALPQTEAADDLRHALVLRIGHTLLMAWSTTDDRAWLVDAQSMLLRYADVHERLFGDGEAASAQRGDVYELLYEVETELDPPPSPEPEPPDDGDDESPPHDSTPRRGNGDVREIVVHTSRLASLDDPRVQARLRSSYSNPFAGLVSTKGIDGVLHEARPLVRTHGIRLADADASRDERQWARRAGLELVRTKRPELRACYRDAFARSPQPVVDGTVTIDVQADGSIAGAEMAGDGLDAIGRACVAIRLADGTTRDAPGQPRRIVLALRFFYEGTKTLQGSLGGQTGPWGTTSVDPGAVEMPPIEGR